MDAKPQRPSRVLRVHDENQAAPAVMPAKTLHQRTKSVPTFSTVYQADAVKAANKKVLGQANANLKIAQSAKDDSAIEKKGVPVKPEVAKPVAAFARPAARPAAKSFSAQTVPFNNAAAAPVKSQNLTQIAEVAAEPPKKLVVKKSKVLKDFEPQATAGTEDKLAVYPGALRKKIQPSVPESEGVALPAQEIRKTETVPLRDEGAPRQASSGNHVIPAAFASEHDYMLYLEAQASHLHMPKDQAVAVQALPSQQYDEAEDDYYYEDGYTTSRSFGLRGESTGGVTTVLAPKQSAKVEQELAAAKAFVETTRTQEDVEDEQWDTSMVAEYGDEIFDYMRNLENRMAPNPRYMDQQQEIQWSMRAVLIDWVVQVHGRFNLLPETLFLTINYIDRFLSCKIVSLGKLQLVGATAIFVAAKYEEVNCPTIQEIIFMVDGGYSAEELLKAERFMLSMLQFELGWPGPMSFLRRISKADDYDLETRTLAKYFLEVTIMDERFVGCTPSFLAAGAHCMARLMLRKGDWSFAHVHFSGYTYTQLRQLLSAMLECCEDPRKHHLAVYDKYTDKRYKRASTYVEGEMMKGFVLPRNAAPTADAAAVAWPK